MKKKIVQQINVILEELILLIDKGKSEDVTLCREALVAIEKKCEAEGDGGKLSCYFSEIKALIEKRESADKLKNIVNDLQNALEHLVVYEALFLPYKASMWDSFETVYQAVLQDDKWKAIVMPIPYHNINPQREVLSREYEGNLFPENVKITSYLDYDLEEEKPDIIFIHNPYDQYNVVTEVLQEYFSSNLKKVCEHLVYIPYYVVEKEMGKNQCYMPGPKNAWRVIAQNEACKKQFVEIGGIDAERVLALGSPKFDKVNKDKDALDIPCSWKEKIDDRKVVFLNTHLSKVLADTERFFKQIRDIIQIFKERDNEVLLWRPHPLSIQTAKALNPLVLEEYLSLIDEFKGFNLGIYDDTSDLNRAIVISDAYIGDRKSSVDQLFEETGKPMYFLDGNADEIKDKTRYLRSTAGECIGNKLYCSNFDSNLFTIVDLETGQIEYWKESADVLKCKKVLYSRSIEYKGQIYFLPAGANDYVAKFSQTEKKMRFIKLENLSRDYNPVIEADKLYLFPVYYADRFPCIDLETNQVEYIPIKYSDEVYEYLNNNLLDNSAFFFGATCKDGRIYRVSRFASIIQIYDLRKKRFEYLECRGIDNNLQTILATEEDIYILPQNYNGFYIWDEKKNCIKKQVDLSEFVVDKDMKYVDMYEWQEYVVFVGGNSSIVVFVHKKSGNVEDLDCSTIVGYTVNKELLRSSVNISFSNAIKQTKNESLVFIPNAARGIVIIDKNLSSRFIPVKLSKEVLYDFARKQIIVNDVLCTLDEFLDIVGESHKNTINQAENVGVSVWKNITQAFAEVYK